MDVIRNHAGINLIIFERVVSVFGCMEQKLSTIRLCHMKTGESSIDVYQYFEVTPMPDRHLTEYDEEVPFRIGVA